MTLLRQLLACVGLLLVSSTSYGQFFSKDQPVLLPEADAFKESVAISSNPAEYDLGINWSIADGYYMYRDQFAVVLENPQPAQGPEQVELALTFTNSGTIEDDPEFGNVEVYFFNAAIKATLPKNFSPQANTDYGLKIKGQGCNKPVGVCYPPMVRTATVSWTQEAIDAAADRPDVAMAQSPNGTSQAVVASDSDSNDIAAEANKGFKGRISIEDKTFWGYVLSAFGAGLLLSFTPCVLPMIPILSGVIAKQHSPNKLRAGWLATCYVFGTVVTYLAAGWIAGATGTQLQAYFQSPWVIGTICLLLILLAASLFGAFKIQTPVALQTQLHAKPSDSDSFLAIKSFGLGLVSALVVGACVSPILILALGAAISQGDPVLGAAIMGTMALGMGVLLIAFGFGAGWILPKTGAWMTQIQILFGFMVLGVAIFIASALTAVPVLLLWSLLLLALGFYLWQLADVDLANESQGLGTSVGKALALASLLWGALALIGHATGGRDILAPLTQFSAGNNTNSQVTLPFETTTTLAATQAILESAQQNKQPVLVDFYADWCFDCVRMKRTTFKEADVAAALSNWRLVVVDVTDTSPESESLKRYFDVFGPPATLFIKPDGTEAVDLRQYGYIDSPDFLTLISKVN